MYEKSKKGYLPALLAYARDTNSNITGGQYLLIDKDTNGKADVDTPKKSFGVKRVICEFRKCKYENYH